MTTTEIISQAKAAGLRLRAEGDKLVLSADQPPAQELVIKIQQHKAAVIEALNRESCEESEESPDRYGVPPDTEIPLAPTPPRLSDRHGDLLTAHVLRQSGGRPGPPLDWVMRQANRYWDESQPRWDNRDCEHAAALDLVLWQRGSWTKARTRLGATKEILEILEGVDEVAESLKDWPAAKAGGRGGPAGPGAAA